MTKHGKIEKGIYLAQLQLKSFKREAQQSRVTPLPWAQGRLEGYLKVETKEGGKKEEEW